MFQKRVTQTKRLPQKLKILTNFIRSKVQASKLQKEIQNKQTTLVISCVMFRKANSQKAYQFYLLTGTEQCAIFSKRASSV